MIIQIRAMVATAALCVAIVPSMAQAGGLFSFSKCDSLCCDDPCADNCGCGNSNWSGCDGCGGCDSACRGLGAGSCLSGGGCGDYLQKLDLRRYILPSDRCFDDFISPMINFVFFEDPRTLSELRPIFLHQSVPGAIGGGTFQHYGLQTRAALTERLSFISTKRGFIVSQNPLFEDGFTSTSIGLKYNVIRDPYQGTLASVGMSYDLPIGSRGAGQSFGDGQFHLFITAGQRFLDGDAHYLSSFGYRFPTNSGLDTTSIHWSHHVDVRLTDKLYALTGISWWHWTRSASNGQAIGAAGHDLFSLPANDVTGNNLVTQNVGLKYRPRANREFGIAYEFPISDFRDVMRDRIQLDAIFRY